MIRSDEAPVMITLQTDWQSGSATVHVTISFGAADLDTALALVKRATDGAPLLKTPEEVQ